MAGAYDSDFDHEAGNHALDALGAVLSVGDTIAHIAKVASRTRVTRRKILSIDIEKGTMVISPNISGRFKTYSPGLNVRGANVLRLCKCQ